MRTDRNEGQTSAIRNVIRESMRLYPIAPFIARYLPQEMSVCSYRIPANVGCRFQALFKIQISTDRLWNRRYSTIVKIRIYANYSN